MAVYCGGYFDARQQTVYRLYAADGVTHLSEPDYERAGSQCIGAAPTRAAPPRAEITHGREGGESGHIWRHH